MLNKQYNLYSVDTGHFYSNHEKYLHDMNCKYRKERNYVQNQLPELEKQLKQLGYTDDDIKHLKNNKSEEVNVIESSDDTVSKYISLIKLIKHKREKAKESKEKLLTLLSNKATQNERTDGKDHIRYIKEDSLNDTNVISIFDSALSRTIGIKQDEFTEDLMIVQVYYFDVFKDISFYGFVYKGEKYKYFTSSAGQIRKKKAVFIKETIWNQVEKTIMCGLTIDKINAKGGNNVNKHLAYMALTNSATDEWQEFDIDKTIVIDDFETNVYGTFDFVDETDYSITRKTDYIPIPHTDGAGMILPSVSTKNFMFRAPWIKGLLGVFDFKRFIEENNYSPVIIDIYGKEHNVIKEDIQVIFTKSQMKMWKYYDSWEEYKDHFRKYHCNAGRCNIEADRIGNAKINYQMLQTLTDITDNEIDLLTQKSAERIRNVCNSKDTMLDILGVTPYNTHMTPFQKAVKLYPALLNDTYAKDVIREVKNSLLKKYRSGKLEVNGKYTFLLPDFYAACEYWFGHIDNPTGLLDDKEVFCWLFKRYDKLDCLRSPHLYKEHAIRFNIANDIYNERAGRLREWFTTDGLYASTHDFISKILMYDVDGDQSLVVADKDFVKIAERNMNGIVPLYYNMRRAEPTEINNKNIYAGLIAAFTGGNIGTYSNNISKIWNHDVFITGTDEEKQEAISCVKRLCCQNNFVIDYAKTLYKPEFPHEVNEKISNYTNGKLPAFFEYAKDKEKSQVQNRNKSFVNKIYDRIPNKPINTRGLKLGQIDYHMMMSNPKIICSREVSDLYDALNKQYRYMINMKDEDGDNLHYIACKIREAFIKFGYSDETLADMLVEYLYGRKKRYKQLLWFCYGQYAVNNIEKNLKDRGEYKNSKYVQCIDCGEWFETGIRNMKKVRCDACQREYRKQWDKNRKNANK
ncbi:MAG: hypothetical protein NC225_10600 [Clostridium sp.]|nr:hypothetical protein [Clostridium sp.]MCM1460717.1 hypothetical protein [Bacteroides sp.]